MIDQESGRMDDSVLEQFQSTFLLSGEVHDTFTPHPHYTLYKAKKEGYGSQETRRRAFMDEQKSRRRDFADMARKIADGCEVSGEENEEEMEEGNVDEVDGKKGKSKKNHYPYRKQLMLSEWLVDVPPDFEENWFAVIVPLGRRSLVVSARKTTSAYSRAGALLNNFPSLLPGGSKQSHRLQRDYCILDCIFHEPSQSYYILDVMCWAGHPVYDSDVVFRIFWKEQKLKECGGASTYSRINPLPFLDLPYYPCTKASLSKILSQKPPFEVDGLLFIHKQCRYILGRTPLAVWLKPHMIKDILGVEVSPSFLALSPAMESTKKRGGHKMDVVVGEVKEENKNGEGKGEPASETATSQSSTMDT